MAFWDKLTGEFIDIIEWTDDSNDTLVWRFERYQNEIKNGAKLTVRQQQVAIFVNEGQIADVFTSGMHELKKVSGKLIKRNPASVDLCQLQFTEMLRLKVMPLV